MLTLSPSTRIYIVAGVTDMRRSFNGLAAIVTGELELDLLSGHLFVFSNYVECWIMRSRREDGESALSRERLPGQGQQGPSIATEQG